MRNYTLERFTGQANIAFVGAVKGEGRRAVFTVQRQLADWSAGGGNRFGAMASFVYARFKVGHRLKAECERRGQPVPRVNL